MKRSSALIQTAGGSGALFQAMIIWPLLRCRRMTQPATCAWFATAMALGAHSARCVPLWATTATAPGGPTEQEVSPTNRPGSGHCGSSGMPRSSGCRLVCARRLLSFPRQSARYGRDSAYSPLSGSPTVVLSRCPTAIVSPQLGAKSPSARLALRSHISEARGCWFRSASCHPGPVIRRCTKQVLRPTLPRSAAGGS